MTALPSPTRTDPVAIAHLLEQMGVVVASGIDALYLSGRGDLQPDILEELACQRDLAEAQLPATIHLGPLPFAVAGHGWGRYRYCAEHPIGRIGISPSGHLPPIRVQPRSEFLHAVGADGAVDVFTALLGPACANLGWAVSRVDLYADVTGFPLHADLRRRFVCRADTRRTYEAGGRCSGFDFGSRRSGTVCGRIYDKTLDVERTGHDWWHEIWGDHRDGRVTRVELELGRKALADFGLNHPAAVLAAAGGLWTYGTGQWLTFRTPTTDTNRARWPIAPIWHTIQQARLATSHVELERLRTRNRAGSLRRLTPGLIGYLVGFAALVGTTGIDDTLEALAGHIRNDEIVRRTRFDERIGRRRSEGTSE